MKILLVIAAVFIASSALTSNLFAQAWPYVPTTMETKLTVDASTVALYHMDDGSGTTVTDATGTYPGTLHGGATWVGADGGNVGNTWPTPVHGASGDCVTFDGVNGYMDVSGLFNTFPANWTVEMWFRVNSTPSANVRLFAKYINSSPYSDMDCFLGANSVGIDYRSGGGTVYHLSGGGCIQGSWNYVAMTYDGTNLREYLNGKLFATAAVPAMASPGTPATFSFGGLTQPGAGPCCYSPVTIDEIRLSNKARSLNEIKQSFWRRLAPQPDGSTEVEKLVKHGAILTANGGWEGTTSLAEPSPYYVGGVTFEGTANVQWVMSYSGNCFVNEGIGIAYTTDANGLTGWTRSTHNPIVAPNGTSPGRSKLIYYSGTYYLFYSSPGSIALITTTGNGTYSSATTVLNSSSFSGGASAGNWQNSGILPPRSVGRPWQMWVEGGAGSFDGGYVWAIAYATCSNANPATGFTLQGSNYIKALELGPAGGTFSAPDVRDINGVYFMHYSGSETGSFLPTRGYAAVSLDSGTTWTRIEGCVIDIDEQSILASQDQVSGLKSRDNDGSTSLIVYDIDRNSGGGASVICAATYPGSLECLIDCFRCVNPYNLKSWP